MKIEVGLKSKLKTLKIGVLAFCSDTKEFYIGTETGNYLINGSSGVTNAKPTTPVIALVSTGYTTATISLTTASTDTEDGIIANYEVYKDGILHSTATLTQGGTYQLTGLSNGTLYNITVKAKDSDGLLSNASNIVQATTTVPPANAIPTAPVIAQSSVSESTISITLTTASTDTEDGTITKYNVYKNSVLHASNVTLSQGGSYQLTGLSANTSYAITLKAIDSVGALSSVSNTINATTFISAFSQNFNVANQSGWGSDFNIVKYGTVDATSTTAEILNNQGVMNVKTTSGVYSGINAVATTKLDFTNNKKYRISFKEQNTGNATNADHLGIALTTGTVFNGFMGSGSGGGGATSGDRFTFVHASTEKFLFRPVVNDVGSSKTLGTTGFNTTDLVVSNNNLNTVVMEVSTSTLKITINGSTYVDGSEDLSYLNNANVSLVFLFNLSNDNFTTINQGIFDDLLVERIA